MRNRSLLSDHLPVTRGGAFALLAILGLAILLRIFKLDAALWFDEIATLLNFVRLPFGELLTSYDSLNNHMFFSIQAKAAVTAFGESAWALRLPAVVLGVASIWALWRLALQFSSQNVALFSALLMTVSYHHVWFSQNARGYTGLLFFGLLATAFLIRAVQRPGQSDWMWYMACLVLATYAHLSAAFFFLAQGVAWLALSAIWVAKGRELPPGWVKFPLVATGVALVALALLYAPVMGQMFETFGGVQQGTGSEIKAASIAAWKNPLWTLKEVARSMGPLLAPALPVVLIIIAVSAWNMRGAALIIPMTFLLHIVLTIVILRYTSFRIWPRYFFVDLGFICLFLVHGTYVIAGWAQARFASLPSNLGGILVACGMMASLVLLPANYRHAKQDFAGGLAYINANAGENDQVMALGLTAMAYVDYLAPHWLDIQSQDDFDRLNDPGSPTWIVYSFVPVIERRFEGLLSKIEADFEKVHYIHGTLSGGGIVILKSKSN